LSLEGWIIFATFWAVFVTTPGPNAVNCIQNGMTHGFRKSLWGVLAILTQSVLFLGLSALGVTAMIAASPLLFSWMKILGAVVLILLGIRSWRGATRAPDLSAATGRSIYTNALLIATVNAKSVAGYLAAFSQFVQTDVPVMDQMAWIFPTALSITALSYLSYTAIGAGLGRMALGAVLNVWFRRTMAVLFILYGVLLGTSAGQMRTG
jgi:threonine/homoserine/homoserine lactone efflux protein